MLALPAAYFPSFDHLVRKQLDPVWNKVGPSTKALVRDLSVLRRLVNYLLSYDSVQFHSFCEMILASGDGNKSQWLMTDAANTIFQCAKRRCFTLTAPRLEHNDDDWDALDDIEGTDKPKWVPRGMDPVLEELPKWSLLAEVLEEIEGEIVNIQTNKAFRKAAGSNTTLIMCSSIATCNLLREFLDCMDQTKPKGQWGRRMMLRKLRTWLYWKNRAAKEGKPPPGPAAIAMQIDGMDDGIDEALKKKDKDRADKRANRRRVRGGAPAAGSSIDRQASVAPASSAAISEDM